MYTYNYTVLIVQVMTDVSGNQAVNTFHLFAKLFQDIKNKLSEVTQEVCTLLIHPQHVKDIIQQLGILTDNELKLRRLHNNRVDCPFKSCC